MDGDDDDDDDDDDDERCRTARRLLCCTKVLDDSGISPASQETKRTWLTRLQTSSQTCVAEQRRRFGASPGSGG
ncbi:uncharacterized protein PADG_11208 [Paracoccidioides brasiliensis Pb18]|uniref:Uncharacterized protein n=1 Tax=Paracoccidioides brasiliensis (strain Pb18) TaxID=502780 RepID=A0A0A0HZJ8_PARBD|nr:uncharacterized protein PADG_11208 [Paracoccidioides brasiliensis Pb18]KGM92750.1 hypothetical protein PADG_11208 [Paracoccidioides brasiliensis Pb18]